MNNMVRLLLKRGVVTDLARIPHSLDLSSPSMANTVNAALKPLETLSRIVNQPQTVVTKSKPKQPATGPNTAASIVETIINNAISTSRTAEDGNVQIEDVTGNEEGTEGLEETEPLSTEEPENTNADVADAEVSVDAETRKVVNSRIT